MITGLSYPLMLLFGSVPWLTRRFSKKLVGASLVVGIAFAVVGPLLSFFLLAWTDFVVVLVALTGGVLLGRSISRPSRFQILLVVLSVLDVLQFIAFSGPPPSSGVSSGTSSLFAYLNFMIPPPFGRFNLGIFDILLVAGVSEHWRRRGSSLVVAELPGVAGFALADVFLLLFSVVGGLPLIPFFTLGFLASEGINRNWHSLNGAQGTILRRAQGVAVT